MPNLGLKIALIGNMNNNLFCVSRYLRQRGFDTTLFVLKSEFEHFHPRADTFDEVDLKHVKEVEWGEFNELIRVSKKRIQKDLKDFDYLIGCGTAPAYCHKAKRELDLFIPYGGDLIDLSSFKIASPQRILQRTYATYFQRKGISKAKVWQLNKVTPKAINTLHDKTEVVGELRYKRFGKSVKRILSGIPMVYAPAPETESGFKKESASLALIKKLRAESDLMVVYHGRHVWSSDKDPNSKGVEILIEGINQFQKKHCESKIQLITLEYGADILKSKEFISQLGFENRTTWLPQLPRKEIIKVLTHADIVCGQFKFSTMACGVVYEGLVAAKPILGHREDSLYQRDYPRLYPMYKAATVAEVVSCLEEYQSDKATGVEMGKEGRKWYDEEVVTKSLDCYEQLITAKAKALNKRCFFTTEEMFTETQNL